MSIKNLKKPEQVLGDYTIACHLSVNSIISDPTRHLTSLQKSAAEGYKKREWVRKRCEKAEKDGLKYIDRMANADTLCYQVLYFSASILVIAQIPVLAYVRDPTMRKCLVLLKELLEAEGDTSIYESLLTILGSKNMKQVDIESYFEESIDAYDRAVEIFRTPFWGSWNVDADVRPLFVDGAMELIKDGHYKEAFWWILLYRLESQIAFENDGLEEETQKYMEQFEKMLADLGLISQKDFQRRAERLRAVLKEAMEFSEKSIETNPDIKD